MSRINRDPFDKFEDNPVKFVVGFWLIALVLNLLFWGALIFGTLYGLNYFGVI